MTYKGSCHCGQVAFEAEGELANVMECNCSFCSKRAALHWFIPRKDFRLLTAETAMGTHTFNKKIIRHRFCLNCGCGPYSEGQDRSGNQTVAVNARCLDGVDLSSVEVTQVDGRSL